MKFVAVCCLIACAVAGKVSADDRWYANGLGGVNYFGNTSKKDPLEVKRGYVAGFAIGKQLGDYVRLEGEFTRRENDFKIRDVIGSEDDPIRVAIDGSHRQNNFMANAIAEILPGYLINPYFGMGVGVFLNESVSSGEFSDSSRIAQTSELKNRNGFSTQEMVGVHLCLSHSSILGAEVRQTHDRKLENTNRSAFVSYSLKF
ncbi:MAG: outer membrane beta-barrel protein [Chlamydiales bacterium]|nr:outer membrane beta-barrel protein [Chlamydiales bacterium]